MMNPANYSLISFPFLGLEVNPPRVLTLGPLTIHMYGLIIAIGLILAAMYSTHRSKEFGLTEDDILDGVLWITPFAIICARIYYCVFSWEEYAADPVSVLYIWNGGLAIYGGVIGACLSTVIYCRVKKISFKKMFDVGAFGLLIGQIMGRWGNFVNAEAYGSPTQTALFRMQLADKGITVHPTFLYESVWNLVGFVLLHFLSKHRKYDGQIALGYGAWYGLGRCFIEGLRVDSLYWGPFRVSQVLAGLTCVIAVGALLWQHFLPHDPADLFVNRVAAQAEAQKSATEETAEEKPEE